MNISKRIKRIAGFVPTGKKVADIGTDHGFLPCFLVKEGISPFVIAVDVHQGPYEVARGTVEAYGLGDKIDVRLGDGLKVIEPGEVEVVVIAGMGGATMVEILQASPEITEKLEKIILQPMNGAEVVRRGLTRQGWLIAEEELIAEDGRIFEILTLIKGKSNRLEERELLYGPLLIKRKDPLLPALLEKEMRAMQEILKQLAKSEKEEARVKEKFFQERLSLTKELKEWLSAAKE